MIVLAILFATCAEVTIVLCYFQLCSEDYQVVLPIYNISGCCDLFFLFSGGGDHS